MMIDEGARIRNRQCVRLSSVVGYLATGDNGEDESSQGIVERHRMGKDGGEVKKEVRKN